MRIRSDSPQHPLDMAAASRTLPSVNSTNTVELTQASLSVRIYLLLLATSLSKAGCNSERSAGVTMPNFQSPAQAFAHAVEQRSVAIHSSRHSWESMSKRTPSWGRNLAPAFCKAHATKLQVRVHCLVIHMFCSQVSTIVVSTTSRHYGVSIDHEALQP